MSLRLDVSSCITQLGLPFMLRTGDTPMQTLKVGGINLLEDAGFSHGR